MGIEESQAPNGQWPSNAGAGIAMPNGALGMNGINGALSMDFSQMMPYMMNGMPNNLMGGFSNMMGSYHSVDCLEDCN